RVLSGRQDIPCGRAASEARRDRRARAGVAVRGRRRAGMGATQLPRSGSSRGRESDSRAVKESMMGYRTIAIVVVLLGFAGAGGYGLYRVGVEQGMKMSATTASAVPA